MIRSPFVRIPMDRSLLKILVISRDAVLSILVQRVDLHAAVIGNKTNELLPDVLHVVVLLEEADVGLNGGIGRRAEAV